jgi:alpha-galactosidase
MLVRKVVNQSVVERKAHPVFLNKINSLNHPTDLTFNLTESPWIRAGRQYSVRVSRRPLAHRKQWCLSYLASHYQDLWTHTDNGTAIRTFKARKVPAHGVVALLLQDAGDEPEGVYPPCAVLEWCMSENGTRIDQ